MVEERNEGNSTPMKNEMMQSRQSLIYSLRIQLTDFKRMYKIFQANKNVNFDLEGCTDERNS